ncbi:unnamed protein product [Rotaria sordida]|uniref:PiggyBac transposable element-derived protein domain-containing protein n=2 Tax=Rotaria sordida TaxID=392033 RepID=A0A819LZL3_9BILA|nr:unnamed protein product [Rotaria sordida]
MTTKSNLKRIREIILTDNDNNNEFDDTVFEDDESNSDSDYSPSGTESDDTSTDECISKEDDSSDSHISDDDISTNTQPESVEKGGITWSIHNSKDHGRLRATSIMKKKPELDRIELEVFLGLLIQAGVNHTNHQSVEELWDIKNLGKSLTNPHNERRSQQVRLTSKIQLALQSLGFELKPKISVNQVRINDPSKRRLYYMCPTHPGRKSQQYDRFYISQPY